MRINHRNIIRAYWDAEADEYSCTHPEHLDASLHPSWGLWHIPEATLKMLGDQSLTGKTILDLGCGRGHDAVAYAQLGAEVLAIDLSSNQLKNSLTHPRVKYIQTSADNVPTASGTIDFAVSDHGAFDHTPAPLLLKEMVRVLRRGGQLLICTYSPLAYACYNEGSGRLEPALQRDYPKNEIRYDGSIVSAEYSYSEWIKMFIEHSFVVERLEELIIPLHTNEYFGKTVSVSWASRWPCDIIWSLRKA